MISETELMLWMPLDMLSYPSVGTIALILLSPIFALAAALCWRWKPRKTPVVWHGPNPSAPLTIPSVDETAESVRRFREAAERAMMLDFMWEHYSKGRAFFLERMRHTAKQRKRRAQGQAPAIIPYWL